jgi:hypothetical protein
MGVATSTWTKSMVGCYAASLSYSHQLSLAFGGMDITIKTSMLESELDPDTIDNTIGWDRTGWDGMGWDGIVQDRMG